MSYGQKGTVRKILISDGKGGFKSVNRVSHFKEVSRILHSKKTKKRAKKVVGYLQKLAKQNNW